MTIFKFTTTGNLTIKLIAEHVVGFRDLEPTPIPAVRDSESPLTPSFASVVVWTSQGDWYQLNEESTKKFLAYFEKYEIQDFT